MKAVLFLNGKPCKFSPKDFDDTFIICADGAYNFICNRLTPDLLVGDFDSLVGNVLPKDVETITFPTQKDYTDGQLAVKIAADRGVNELTIYGALGGRPDQVLVNYSLLKYAFTLGISAKILTDDYTVYWLTDSYCGTAEKDKIISVVPYGDSIHILSTEGLFYRANDLTVDNALITSVSNHALGGAFAVHIRGNALLFVQR